MIPRITTGKGVTGAVRYVLGEGHDPKTGKPKPDAQPGEQSRVEWIGGAGLGFEIKNRDDANLARRVMEFDSLNQSSPTRKCEQDCVHLSLAWRPGETPTRKEMETAAHDALKALGMEKCKAVFVAHNDEDYVHLHIVASRINPATDRAFDLEKSFRKLSAWAQDWEREHGGIVCQRRTDANELRQAIAERDPAAVLEVMTRQRSTFTARQLETALGKEIKNKLTRAEFGNAVLANSQVVYLAEVPGGPTMRYSTRSVIEAEQHVLRAASALARNESHQVDARTAGRVSTREKYDTMTAEQRRAFQHCIGKEGLALIDGQAGTGKSYTLGAVREAYEASGRKVIGLAPTNAVAQDMGQEGFSHSSTVHAELFALNSGRRSWDNKTVVIVDEAAMIDTKLMTVLIARAEQAGAKLILVGDDRQLSSIERGGMFGTLKDRYGAAELSEVRRQYKNDDRRAAEMMADGNFAGALGIYDAKGAVQWTRTQPEARAALIEQWAKDSEAAPSKSRFVFAYTNAEVDILNASLRSVRRARGELGEDHQLETKHGRTAFAQGDRIQFTGTDKKLGLFNGAAGTIEEIDGKQITVKLDGKNPQSVTFDAGASGFQDFRHGYAGTIYKGQGRTLDQTYLVHSENWRSAASYVALTRHRDSTQIFVARNSLNIRKQAEPWMLATGGASALGEEHHDSAQKSYAKWQSENPQAARRHGFESYVSYVQEKWAERKPANDDARPELRELARQMARTDERRAASQFHSQQELGPVRPLKADEILARFSDPVLKRAYDRDRDEDQRRQQQQDNSSSQDTAEPSSEQSAVDHVYGQGGMTEATYSRLSAGTSRASGGATRTGGRGGRTR